MPKLIIRPQGSYSGNRFASAEAFFFVACVHSTVSEKMSMLIFVNRVLWENVTCIDVLISRFASSLVGGNTQIIVIR